MDRTQKLLEAGRLIDEVVASLDTSSDVCDCCGRERKQNWDDSQVADRLKAAQTRLEYAHRVLSNDRPEWKR